jgi:hypothetical protein
VIALPKELRNKKIPEDGDSSQNMYIFLLTIAVKSASIAHTQRRLPDGLKTVVENEGRLQNADPFVEYDQI